MGHRRPGRAAVLAGLALLAACSTGTATTRTALAATDDPALTVPDTATLTDAGVTVHLTLALTCPDGWTAFGSAAVSPGPSPDPSQPQAYSGLLRVPCTGGVDDLALVMASQHGPFSPGSFLVRAAFTLDLCDPGCRSVSVMKPITLAPG